MKPQSKTKVIATIGPSTADYKTLDALIGNGVDVCRINFSHGSHTIHNDVIENIRKISKKNNYNIAILGDLQGPKIRIGEMENDGVLLEDGDTISMSTKEGIGNKKTIYIRYSQFAQDVSAGEQILLDDGKLVMEILKTNGKDSVEARVINGGLLESKKGVNLPNTKTSLPCLTEKDKKDLAFALEKNLEWIGLSFVRSASDIVELRSIINKKESNAKIVAKVEKPEALKEIEQIIKEADALMVARGDLGVEIPMQNVPLIQKDLVQKCLLASKPVIIATQMMDSMIKNYNPTRAEVNDVANSIMDGADAVMLSGETSVGKYPVRVIESVQKIIKNVEDYAGLYNNNYTHISTDRFVTDAICRTAMEMADRTNAKAIITMTFTGYTAFEISSYRPKADIYVFTGNRNILNQLSLIWGVRGFYFDEFISTDHSISKCTEQLEKEALIRKGDLIIHTASMPMQDRGQTNMLKLNIV